MKEAMKKLLNLIIQVKKIVFIQNEFTPEQVRTFAQEIDASVVVINPLAYNFIEEIKQIAYAISR